jgi:SAM-dependent methyltransferase
MTKFLLDYLADPRTLGKLELVDPIYNGEQIASGKLVAPDGVAYPIINGIPRFVIRTPREAVRSFGDEWNFFNYDAFKVNWLTHVVGNTFGTSDVFRDKVIVDAGAGSGMQSVWMLECGAKHVILLELSDSVDDVIQRNLARVGYKNFDVIQCSIDAPPIAPDNVEGIVICHNVIQHTPSVPNTARALFRIVKPASEFVFNCYGKDNDTWFREVRFHFQVCVRSFLKRRSFNFRLFYSRAMATLRFLPILGWILERSMLCFRGDVPRGTDSYYSFLKRGYRQGLLNTFDWYGAHEYQHHLSEAELRKLVSELQPDSSKVLNLDRYFRVPAPIGCAFRIKK